MLVWTARAEVPAHVGVQHRPASPRREVTPGRHTHGVPATVVRFRPDG
jgi:hypothetical protein